MMRGHLTICKVYKDGTKETVLDKANLVTAGLGSSFVDIQHNSGSTYTTDYAPYYFQLGTSTIGYDTDSATSAYFYQVSTPLDWSAYGENTDLDIVKRYRGFYASSIALEPVSNQNWVELLNTSAPLSSTVFSGTDEYFSLIREGRVTKFFMDAFEAEIVLDEKTANGVSCTEIGLFARNPKGFYEDSPLLMAYRTFTAIPKTKDFSLVFHWTLGFLGLSTNIDDYYSGWSKYFPVATGDGTYT